MWIIKNTCFNAALTWEFCANSAALLLWEGDWVAGKGFVGKGGDEESRPGETFKYILSVMWWVLSELIFVFLTFGVFPLQICNSRYF